MQALRTAGIDFEVVPGVTAAFAAAASIEIPLTLRQTASSLLIMTGQFADGRAVPDLRPMLASGTTIALYMPGADARATADKLTAAGVPIHTPCAIISRASTAAQQTTVTTLEKLPSIRAHAKPSILILGEVVKQAKHQHNTFEALGTQLLPALTAARAEANRA
jgi:siroheme synthase